MGEKITSTISYQLGSVYLFYEFMFNPTELIKAINAGPAAVKSKLAHDWRNIRTLNDENGNFNFLDNDRNISQDDFKITFNGTNKNIPVFFISFPESKENMNSPEISCVALVLDKVNPRFFTMECLYKDESIDKNGTYRFGEYIKEGNDRKFTDYGVFESVEIPHFASFVIEKLK